MRRSQSLSSSPSLEILISRCQGRIFPSPGLVGRKQFSFLVFVFKKNQTVQIPRLVPPPRVLYKECELFFFCVAHRRPKTERSRYLHRSTIAIRSANLEGLKPPLGSLPICGGVLAEER